MYRLLTCYELQYEKGKGKGKTPPITRHEVQWWNRCVTLLFL